MIEQAENGSITVLTKQEILNYKTKILSARAVLMRENPFFGLLLMYLKYIAIPGMEQISTNGECIFFSPDLMKKYSQNELKCLLCHQVLHIIMGDIKRPYEYKGDECHYLRDIEVNKKLKECGVGNNYVYVRSIQFEESEYEDYNIFEKPKRKVMVDTDEFWGLETDFIDNGILILDVSEDISTKNNIVSICNQIIKNPRVYRTLNIPKNIIRDWKKEKQGRLNWKKMLNDFIQEETFDYSFCPPDRRFAETDFLFPDFNEKDFYVKKLLFMVDTSGSISEEDLNEVYAELRSITQQFHGKIEGNIGFFDAEVIPPKPFKNIKELNNVYPVGGGGTSFNVIFNYIKNNMLDDLPNCIIIFTDGYAPFPNKSETMNIPILWLINNHEITPPWGKVVRMINNNNVNI